MNTQALITVAGAACSYGSVDVIDHVDLTIERGDLLAVVGPSGSGKTTLLRLLTGAVTPSRGSIVRRAGLSVGYVPQVEVVDWDFPITVSQCLLMGRTDRRLPWTSRQDRLHASGVLERLGLGGLERRHIRELSGGQQQRMFIARALLRRPELLLLDEPTASVDLPTRHEILHLLMDLNDEGLAVVLTTHDLNGTAAHLPLMMCLNRKVIAAGPTRTVLREDVLEATYGAPMRVLEHAGMPVVVDDYHHDTLRTVGNGTAG
jgi:ABC-type Mn2+/Zn2+ transport system ATPase subunit